MDPNPLQQDTVPPESGDVPNESEVFATLHHLVSRIDAESRVEEVVQKAQNLNAEEIQILVDCLSMALDKDATPFKSRAYVWRALIQVVSFAKVFAQNHTLSSKHIIPANDGAYTIFGDTSMRVRVLKQTKEGDDARSAEALISWVHILHANILPLYAVFLEGGNHPSFVTPCTINQSICDYTHAHPETLRMPLISDTVKGLYHIHQLGIVHGGLNPENVVVSNEGRALITGLDAAFQTQASDSSPVRYSAPELLGEDDSILPTQATDIWSLACLYYEVLSGNVPFFQITREVRVAGAILKGSKPLRPGQDGTSGDEIDDAIWQLLLMCWEFEPEARPLCLRVHQIVLGMVIQDTRPVAGPFVRPEALMSLVVNLELAKTSLTQVLSSDRLPSVRVPEHLRKSFSSFLSNATQLNAVGTAAKKLSPNDTQMLVDFSDLVLEDLPNLHQDPICILLSSIMVSTHVIPQCYKLNGLQYDPTPMVEGSHAKVYQGRGQNVRVNATTHTWLVKSLLLNLPDWSHVSHPNIIPFYGVFYEPSATESPRLYVITSSWENGNLEDYSLTLPQKSRIPLILDFINGLIYLAERQLDFSYVRKEAVLISEQGRAVLLPFQLSLLFMKEESPTRELRFKAPNIDLSGPDNIWSFGCLCYKVLSRKLPYYQYLEYEEIKAAVTRGELPKRPEHADDDMDEIDDQAWELISNCCQLRREDRLEAPEVKELMAGWEIEDNRPPAKTLGPDGGILTMRSRPNVNFPHVESLLSKIQVELLRSPLSKLLQSHIKDVTKAAGELDPDDTLTLVDYLDLSLKEHLSISEEQNRVLALLSRITSSTHIFPQRYELKGIKYDPRPMAEGGYGRVHRGTEIDICVKVMVQVNPEALTPWIKELILWAHSSHPNILPFYGVLLEGDSYSHQIYLVSPFMKNGNLHDYAPRLPQKSRLTLISDVIKGLLYLHGLGIIHSDLKGENVLISNEGRCLITDFGTTQITTATATTTTSLVPTTLRFAAPEVVLTSGPPTKERDIWSFGCLCYEVLSRQLPYYQYAQTVQVSAALARKELPKRPGFADQNATNEINEDDWDDDGEDWDEIDDQAWNLITKCCEPEPKDRPRASAVQELIVDMKIWDDRPVAKTALGAEFSKLGSNPEIDLNRVGVILDKLQKTVVPDEEEEEVSFIDLFNSFSIL